MINVSLLGDAALEKTLNRLDEKIAKGALVGAIKKASWPVLDAAKAAAPVGENSYGASASRPFGGPHMRDTLKIKGFNKRGSVGVRIGTGTRKELGIPAGYEWFYPMAVEQGHKRAPAHPFMRPALDRYRGLVLYNLKRELGSEIEKIARGA